MGVIHPSPPYEYCSAPLSVILAPELISVERRAAVWRMLSTLCKSLSLAQRDRER